jgi:ATP-dependent exoDNAse (exonuclease V) alpha subunit
MAIYFLNLKSFGRSGGSSAVSAAAYRSGERIHDERTGKTYDHADRQDVMHKEIVLPSEFADAEMGWARDRSSLWNAAESAETRKNARVAREYLVALPVELSPEQRLKLVRGFSQELSDRYGFALDFTIHAPRDFPDSDPRNFHAHLLATTREVTPNGLGAKTTLEMHDRQRYVRGLGSSIKELVHVRERWAEVTNEALREAHVDARIDHRTLAAQGIDREPRPHIPKAAFEMERHGYRNELAERLREEYRARVEARLDKSATREGVAAAQATAREVASKDLADNQPAAQEAATAQVNLGNGTARPQSLEDIRREARENWLRMRQSQGYGQRSATAKTDHGRDDDFTR